MIEPLFLSVPEFAKCWKQTPRQIIDHALSLRFALYFLFDGLVFDFDNYWYSSTKVARPAMVSAIWPAPSSTKMASTRSTSRPSSPTSRKVSGRL